jgi:hypothetical protein
VLALQQISILETISEADSGEESLQCGIIDQKLSLIVAEITLTPTEVNSHAYNARGAFGRDRQQLRQWKPRWGMIFMWQCPVMFMAYSICLYLLGLTLYICSPLISGDWEANAYVSIVDQTFKLGKANDTTDSLCISRRSWDNSFGLYLLLSFSLPKHGN